jgi:hypothetical protein
VALDCHPEQAFFAQRGIWASRAKGRALCGPIIARLARFLELSHNGRAFTNFSPPLKMVGRPQVPVFPERGAHNTSIIARTRATGAEIMGTSGELIRLINYVDDITTTLRRISAFVAAMEADERKRLAESLKVAGSNLDALIARLEKGGQ